MTEVRDEVDEFCRSLEQESIWLPDPNDPPRVVPADSGDDYLIQLAKDGGVDALVTRDHHLAGIRVPGLEILPPRDDRSSPGRVTLVSGT